MTSLKDKPDKLENALRIALRAWIKRYIEQNNPGQTVQIDDALRAWIDKIIEFEIKNVNLNDFLPLTEIEKYEFDLQSRYRIETRLKTTLEEYALMFIRTQLKKLIEEYKKIDMDVKARS